MRNERGTQQGASRTTPSPAVKASRNRAAWDIYLFYPPDAEWSDAGLPAPAKMVVQAMNVVVGAKGTLPPKGDQSSLPKWYADKGDVVGEQPELGALLTAIAVPFVAQYTPRKSNGS